MATPRFVDLAAVNATIQELAQTVRQGDEVYAMALLRRMVPEFLATPGLALPHAAE